MGIMVYHQKRRNVIKAPNGYESDHIIPYAICMNDDKENIQFLKFMDHQRKTQIDFKILREFRKKGWTEKFTNYAIELKRPIPFLVEEYKKRFLELKSNKIILKTG